MATKKQPLKATSPAARRVVEQNRDNARIVTKSRTNTMAALATKASTKSAAKKEALKVLPKLAPKKPAAPTVLRYKGVVIPLGRKQGEDDTNVPTLEVKTVSDTMKLFEKLPKGCSWGTSGDAGVMNIYNAKGMLVAELRSKK